ncbi:MAG: hypothetical protein WDO19_02180 [Bacteroidota bacterium]
MDVETKYLNTICKSILNNDKSIKEVKGLEYIKVVGYTKDNLAKVNELLSNKKYQEISLIPEGQMSEETLLIMKFMNQENDLFIATVYDNDRLWQDPEVINIFHVSD